MGLVDEPLPTTGESKYTAEADVRVLLAALKAEFNGGIDQENLSPALQAILDLSSRGKCIVATEEVRSDTAFGTLTTPDIVEDVVVPSGALVLGTYQAMWKESVTDAGRAALFVNSTQVQMANAFGAPAGVYATTGGTANTYQPLASFPGGLVSGVVGGAHTGDVTTGQLVGVSASGAFPGEVYSGTNTVSPAIPVGGIFVIDNLAAGTYDISVQFRSTSGSVTAKERRLKVWVEAF